jgi:hypothetical protein
VTLKSEQLVKPLEDWVPLYVHAVKHDKAYGFARQEYLPDFYLHPVFVFLDSRGEEISPELMKCHEALTPGQLVELLKKALVMTPKGLTRKQYVNASSLLGKAKAELESGSAAKAKAVLERLVMLEPDCGLRARARKMLDDLQDSGEFLLKLASAANEAGVHEIAGEIAEYLQETYKGLEPAEKSAGLELPEENDSDVSPELLQAYSDAFYAAAPRDYVECAAALSEAGPGARQLREAAKALSAKGYRIDNIKVHTKGEKNVYHDLRVMFSNGASWTESLRIQYYFLTDKGRVFAGYEKFGEVEPLSDCRSAAAVSGEMLKEEKIVNARAELYMRGELVSSKNLHAAEKEWWNTANPGGVLFYGRSDCGWSSPGLESSAGALPCPSDE